MAADALAPFFIKSPAAVVLTLQDKGVLSMMCTICVQKCKCIFFKNKNAPWKLKSSNFSLFLSAHHVDSVFHVKPLSLIFQWFFNFSEIIIEIHIFSSKRMHLNMLSGKWRPFCLGLNVLRLLHEDHSLKIELSVVTQQHKPPVTKLTSWRQGPVSI